MSVRERYLSLHIMMLEPYMELSRVSHLVLSIIKQSDTAALCMNGTPNIIEWLAFLIISLNLNGRLYTRLSNPSAKMQSRDDCEIIMPYFSPAIVFSLGYSWKKGKIKK